MGLKRFDLDGWNRDSGRKISDGGKTVKRLATSVGNGACQKSVFDIPYDGDFLMDF